MRILHIFDDYGTPGERALPGMGSVSSIVYYLAKYAVEEGHDVTILERSHGKLPETESIDGIHFARIHAGMLPAPPYQLIQSFQGFMRLLSDGYHVATKLHDFIKDLDFDVIHVHFPFAVNFLIHFNRAIREKLVYTAHVGEETKRFNLNSQSLWALRLFSPDLYLMKRVKKSVVLNEPLKSKLVLKGLPEGNLEAIPNGIEVEAYGKFSVEETERVKDKYGLTENTTILFVGTMTPRKGVEVLLKALNIIVNHYGTRHVLLLLVGNLSLDTSYGEYVKEYVKTHKLESHVNFTGFISKHDLRILYTLCDVFVLPSFEEGFGITLTEAMASGKPLIGTNIGGISTQIMDKWNGFLMDPGNVGQLAELIQYVLMNPSERERMGRNSRRLAEEFDWSRIIGRYLKLYEEVGNIN